MKQRRITAVSIIIILLLTGCNSYETKTYVLDDNNEESDEYLYNDSDSVYDYYYSINTYGNEELAKSKTACCNPNDEDNGSIIINKYSDGDNKNYITKLDYKSGKTYTSKGKVWQECDTLLGMSPNGSYMVFVRELVDYNYIMVYDYQKDKETIITWYDTKEIPSTLFQLTVCWADKGNRLIYGWKYIGVSKQVVALDDVYDYNNWGYIFEKIYNIYCYDVAKQDDFVVYEFTDWKSNRLIYNYSIQSNDNGYVLIHALDEEKLYLFNLYRPWEKRAIDKMFTYLEHYWLGSSGIYVQLNGYNLMCYNFQLDEWVGENYLVTQEIDHFIVTKKGDAIYFSVRQKPKQYGQQEEKISWNIFRVTNDWEDVECLYRGVKDLIGIELSKDEENLMLEMRDNSYESRRDESMLTRLLFLELKPQFRRVD